MSTGTTSPTPREPELLGQTVVVIGGSAGIGLETARRARAEGARLILTGRDPERLRHAASELGALSTAAFDAMDPAPLERFFRDLPAPIDHVMLTAGRPTYGRLVDMDLAQMRRALEEHLLLSLQVARQAANKVRPGGTLLLMGGTGARRPGIGLVIASTVTAALPALTTNLALELAPSASTSPPASSTHRCRHHSSAISSRTAAITFARRFPSGAWSDRPTLPRSPSTS
jgi:NAD(P)-dependent dehydrogenase (short-subunit alcohol dehydrogenase family)